MDILIWPCIPERSSRTMHGTMSRTCSQPCSWIMFQIMSRYSCVRSSTWMLSDVLNLSRTNMNFYWYKLFYITLDLGLSISPSELSELSSESSSSESSPELPLLDAAVGRCLGSLGVRVLILGTFIRHHMENPLFHHHHVLSLVA